VRPPTRCTPRWRRRWRPGPPSPTPCAWLHGLRAGLEREYRDGCPIAPTALESAHAGERLRAAAAHAFGRWTGAIERALAAEGWPADEARRTAIAVLALGEGALLLSRTARDGEALTAVAEQVARLATRPA